MAKRKLSPEDREALRREMSEQIKSGAEQSDVLKAVSAKYSISVESARWYLKSMKGVPKRKKKSRKKATSKRKAKPVRRPKTRAKVRRKRKRRIMKGRKAPGAAIQMKRLVEELSEAALRRALSAKALFPKLEKQRRRETSLKEAHRKSGLALREAARGVEKLKRKIQGLLRR